MAKKFDLKDYATVEERLKLYGQDNPDFRVRTEVLQYDPDDKVVIRAVLYRNGEDQRYGLFHSTGIAEETPEGYVNSTSRVENCETSAIGRALANVNYSGKGGRPSREEMEKVKRLSEARSSGKLSTKRSTVDDVKDKQPETVEDVPFEPDVDDPIIKEIRQFDDSSELVAWFTDKMNSSSDPGEFKEKYLEFTQEQLGELD